MGLAGEGRSSLGRQQDAGVVPGELRVVEKSVCSFRIYKRNNTQLTESYSYYETQQGNQNKKYPGDEYVREHYKVSRWNRRSPVTDN